MRLLLDMGISVHLIPELRAAGHDVAHLSHLSLEKMEDPDIMAKARAEGSVLVAHDLDFPELIAASGARLPSVILVRLRSMRPDNVVRYLLRVLDDCRPALEEGAIVTVKEGAFRVRSLPIDEA